MTAKSYMQWVLASAVLLPVGAYVLAVRPIERQKLALEQDMAAKHAALAVLTHSTLSISRATSHAVMLRTNVSDFESRLLPLDQMDTVLADVWQMAQANSLQTRAVRTPAIRRAQGFTEQTMELSLAGDFGGFYQFLLQVEDAKHFMRVRKMHIGKAPGRDGEIQADMTVSVFFQPRHEARP